MKSLTHWPSQQALQASMNYHLLLQPILAIFFVLFFHHLWLKMKKKKNKYSKHQNSAELLYHKLTEMADVYKPAFTLRLGRRRMLVISNWELAKECRTKNEENFANHPLDGAAKLLSFDFQYWRETRRIAALQLLSNRQLESLKHESFYLAVNSVVFDALPYLELFDFQGNLKSMRPQDFIDVVLFLVEDGSFSSSIDPVIFIKANVVKKSNPSISYARLGDIL
ncbi:hypothetical protein AMTRI_Chr13g124970 [Amborella trichopoda]